MPAGASAEARALIEKARAGSGIDTVPLFGVSRMLDFSQFTPRGHYTEAPLSQYFQAMMWLGRVDFRLIETLSDGSSAFRREQYEAMLAVHQLMEGRPSELWSGIDTVVRSFVGEKKLTHEGILGTIKGFIDVNEERLDYLAGILDLSTNYFQHTGTQTVARRAVTRAYGEI